MELQIINNQWSVEAGGVLRVLRRPYWFRISWVPHDVKQTQADHQNAQDGKPAESLMEHDHVDEEREYD